MIIHIITFQRTKNCGAALQAYATNAFLRKNGHHAVIVDYCPKWMKSSHLFSSQNAKQIAKNWLLYPHFKMMAQKFKKFVDQYCVVTKEVTRPEDIPALGPCDMYITGSDQVWNTEITRGVDEGYLLLFETSSKKISFAASCGWDDLDDQMLNPIVEAVKQYAAVSVRERKLAEALQSRGIHQVKAVWDPVFLLDAEAYKKILKKTKLEKYVLIYTKEESQAIREIADKVAKHEHLKIVDMSKVLKKWPADYVRPNYGPREFLGLFSNADYVVTNSFHGTAFSIIFRKNFYSVLDGKRTIRIKSLLEDAGLENRMVHCVKDIKQVCAIDYTACEECIKMNIENERRFLLECCKE